MARDEWERKERWERKFGEVPVSIFLPDHYISNLIPATMAVMLWR